MVGGDELVAEVEHVPEGPLHEDVLVANHCDPDDAPIAHAAAVPKRVCRSAVCAAGPRCSHPCCVLGRARTFQVRALSASLPGHEHRAPTTSDVSPDPPNRTSTPD